VTLVLQDLSKVFALEGKAEVVAISRLNLQVNDGEFVSILGPSGCGKTTLLRIIAGLDHASGGTILLNGNPIVGPCPRMGMIFQEYSLYPWKTVMDNIAFGLELKGI